MARSTRWTSGPVHGRSFCCSASSRTAKSSEAGRAMAKLAGGVQAARILVSRGLLRADRQRTTEPGLPRSRIRLCISDLVRPSPGRCATGRASAPLPEAVVLAPDGQVLYRGRVVPRPGAPGRLEPPAARARPGIGASIDRSRRASRRLLDPRGRQPASHPSSDGRGWTRSRGADHVQPACRADPLEELCAMSPPGRGRSFFAVDLPATPPNARAFCAK